MALNQGFDDILKPGPGNVDMDTDVQGSSVTDRDDLNQFEIEIVDSCSFNNTVILKSILVTLDSSSPGALCLDIGVESLVSKYSHPEFSVFLKEANTMLSGQV